MPVTTEKPAGATAIRPFTIETPEAELEALRARIAATRWPEKETVADQSQGVQLETIQALARHWAKEYDWRECEARLNALPQFITKIDGLDIHFIHVRSKHDNALPLIVTHGWPGSVIEQLKVIEPLTNPTAHGGRAEDAAWRPLRLRSADPRQRNDGVLPDEFPSGRVHHRHATHAGYVMGPLESRPEPRLYVANQPLPVHLR